MDNKLVEEGLEVFSDLINYKASYVFPEKSAEQVTHTKLKKKLPDFSATNFGQFVKWFDKFEKYAKTRSLTKGDIFMLLDMELSSVKKNAMEIVLKEPNIKTLLDVEMVLVRTLFKQSVVKESMRRILMDPYDQKKIYKIIKEFENRCRELVIASLSFGDPINLSSKVLILRLLSLLPKDLRERSRESIELCDIDSMTVREAIDYIYNEEVELDIDKATQEYVFNEWLKEKDYI